MRVDALHYDLPPELIAQQPAAAREHARLMHVPPGGGVEHRRIGDLPDLIPPGALVVVNDTRVLPARLLGKKRDTGGKVEVFLLKQVEPRAIEIAPGEHRLAPVWRALGKSTKPLRFGTDVEVAPRPHAPPGSPSLRVRLLGRAADGLLEVALFASGAGGDVSGDVRGDVSVDAAIRACGHVPLPPYIKRDDALEDAERYQTVYARHDGAVAAPTAGLHLTQPLLDRLTSRGCEIAPVTLHVGLGTFQPVTVQDLDDHPMHAEQAIVTPATVDAVDRARARGAPVVAIGTTTTRALESASDPERPGRIRAMAGPTRLLIQPGYAWGVVDAMLTNFHLPGSTLLAMVCAFVGVERVLDAYRVAVGEKYRFFSYGDAMLLARSP